MSQRGILIPIVLSFASIAVASIPSAPPAPPAAPGAPNQFSNPSRSQPVVPSSPVGKFMVMSAGKTDMKRMIDGKITMGAFIPAKADIASVAYYMDGKEITRSSQKPYRIEWDSATVADGGHEASWKAFNSTGAEVAGGLSTIVVANHGTPQPNAVPVSHTPAKPTASVTEVKKPVHAATPAASPLVAGYATFTSPKYKFRVEYPSDWVIKDQSSSLDPSWTKGYWLLFSMGPVDQSNYVVNIRHKLLKQAHTADSFAKFTPYIASWDRQEINGSPAFFTTAGSPSAKRVVHRAMVINGHHLWMMNIIDKSGKPAAESKELFVHMVQSLTIDTGKTPTPVKVKTKPGAVDPTTQPGGVVDPMGEGGAPSDVNGS